MCSLDCIVTLQIEAYKQNGLIDKVPHIELFEEKNERDRVACEEEFKALLELSSMHLKENLVCLQALKRVVVEDKNGYDVVTWETTQGGEVSR